MSGRYKKSTAESCIETYIDTIKKKKRVIRKNFDDMDLKNANVRDGMELQIEFMEQVCDELIKELQSYVFE